MSGMTFIMSLVPLSYTRTYRIVYQIYMCPCLNPTDTTHV